MKKIYIKFFIIVISLTIMTVSLAPFLISAEDEKREPANKTFCEYIEEVSLKVDQRIANRNTKLGDKRSQIADKISERRDKRNIKFQEKHDKWDVNRSEHFAKLEGRAKTDEQKQALIDFKKIISDAIIARRAAINSIVQEFRNAVDDLKISRKTFSNQAISIYQNEIESVFVEAKTDCANDVDPKIIRKNLREGSKEAQKNFRSNKKTDKNKDEIEALIIAKKEATKQVINDFKETIQGALADFKELFPENESKDELED